MNTLIDPRRAAAVLLAHSNGKPVDALRLRQAEAYAVQLCLAEAQSRRFQRHGENHDQH